MEYTRWPTPQQPPPPPPQLSNPNPPSLDTYSTSYYQYYPQNPNPISTTAPPPPPPHDSYTIHPPGVDSSYASIPSYPLLHLPFQGQDATGSYGHHHQTVGISSSGYYSDPNSQALLNFGADPVGYGAGVSNGTENLAIANPKSTLWVNSTAQTLGNGNWKYPKKMKTKIVQSAYCQVCKIDCNSKDVLDQHRLGKKHQKNLEKLTTDQSVAGSNKPIIIGPQEQQKNKKNKAAEPEEDLETKRRKVLKGGAAAEAVRTCAICNVVCNSETVFRHHLTGQKHVALMKKLATGEGVATANYT